MNDNNDNKDNFASAQCVGWAAAGDGKTHVAFCPLSVLSMLSLG